MHLPKTIGITTAPMPKPHTALGIGVESPEREKVFGRARTWNGKPDPKGNALENNAGIQNAGMRECRDNLI
jgi:hypothetical protein